MKMRAFIVFGLPLAFLAGCTPSYGPRYFSEQEHSPDRYSVRFAGGDGWSREDAVEHLTLLRSAELTLDKGFRYFAISARRYSNDVWAPPTLVRKAPRGGRIRCSGSESPGFTPTGDPTCETAFPSSLSRIYTYDIVMFREEPDAYELVAYDAEFVRRVLRRRYGFEPSPRPPDHFAGDDGA